MGQVKTWGELIIYSIIIRLDQVEVQIDFFNFPACHTAGRPTGFSTKKRNKFCLIPPLLVPKVGTK